MSNEYIEPWQKMMSEWQKTQTSMNQEMMDNMQKWGRGFEKNDNSYYSNNPTLDIFQLFIQKVFEHNPQYNLQSSRNWQDVLNTFPGSDGLMDQMSSFIKGNKVIFDKFKQDMVETLPDDETKDYFLSTLDDISNPYSWLKFSNSSVEEGLKRFSEGPLFSGISDLDNRIAKAMDGWLDLGEKNNDYYEVLLKSWMSAYEKFIAHLNELGEERQSISPKKLLEIWSVIADEELTVMHRSAAFLQAQKSLIKANAEYRIQEQDVAEVVCEAMHIPTRKEVDDLHKTVTELRRELRSLKKLVTTANKNNVSTSDVENDAKKKSIKKSTVGKNSVENIPTKKSSTKPPSKKATVTKKASSKPTVKPKNT